ncbi:MAG: class I SAM-dependent methyltransferase [Atopobiaceae bacterium]|nr:class I SAM-dependent methyltransferase [Atopobiaceae bacterium]
MANGFDNTNYQAVNAHVIDQWIADGWQWGIPVDHEVCARAAAGDWSILLTPTKPVPREWFGELAGTQVLGLASGGGQQMPILSLAGAHCTVLDYSSEQIESERVVAEREGYDITLVQADMSQPLPFADASFDLVFNPVSLCYVREIDGIWAEVARVLKPGGALLAGLDLGLNYIFDDDEREVVRGLPYDPIAHPELMEGLDVAEWGIQFSHTVGELLHGILAAGLVLDDAFDDINGEGRLSELGIPTMLALKAHKA